MKRLKFLVMLAVLNIALWVLPQHLSAQQASVSFQLFYDELSPYGMWVDYPNYGYVWIPNGNPGFSPYATEGHWVFTDDGWMWFSDYPWGWAAFHYGRWDYDDSYGWFWVPDNEWGPAWVSWRRSPGYYGWAPLRPGISINISFGSDYHERNERWIFVREGDITRTDVSRHYVNRTRNSMIIDNSTVIINTRKDDRRNLTYIAGPDRDDVQKATRSTLNSVSIRDNDQPGHRLRDGELQIYRPQIQKRNGNEQRPAPSKVIKLNEVRPVTERNSGDRQRDVNPITNDRNEQQRESPDGKPSNSRVREKQLQNVSPPNDIRKEQQPESRDVKPSNNRVREKQPQTVSQPDNNRKAQPSQPKTIQGGKEKRRR